ncbi:MAG TPA: hypothetical protein VND93_23475 [Myxococcales bacterium]|jgi:hypothetical protein|nr:hypothetical protein [Myxococcales bacterium]
MIAGPHQTDRTLIELFANKLSTDPAGAAELFTETAEFKPPGATAHARGRAQIQQQLAKAPQVAHRVTAHLPRQGDDNFAEILVEGPGAEQHIHTVRFRTDGHSITQLDMVSSRKA